jgi:putative endonuclease
MRTHQYYVYIATNRSGTLYTGATNDAARRLAEHAAGHSVFTSKYRIWKLLFAESTGDVRDAIAREKQIKGWTRAKKLALIRSTNPMLRDLARQPSARRLPAPAWRRSVSR